MEQIMAVCNCNIIMNNLIEKASKQEAFFIF